MGTAEETGLGGFFSDVNPNHGFGLSFTLNHGNATRTSKELVTSPI